MTAYKHSVDILREQCRVDSTRPFLARGSNTRRCENCLMAEFACFCFNRTSQTSPIHFILLFHRDEIHKPTNSGRLIADLFPHDTEAFLWDRTQPSKALLASLEKAQNNCTVLFPRTDKAKEQKRSERALPIQQCPDNTKHTFVILDGTWKQASKMFHQSEWLKALPHLELNSDVQRSFLVRHSKHQMQFATAEVTAMLLSALGHNTQSDTLLQYYTLFNERCLASRKRGNELTV
ncbi:DTW domain-containing protein [Marinomonas sp. A79]|uniref:tRNA-uridine aminocarboxypropyltransferase n=1 Tax=Marinomonas vulgaris TaxID=2823372 RepID=A0ABS5H8Y1_9GAMM|nr:tRNA-uridine aminocarboxypropyltransferase [Marinomonas vulgaris]MBR7887897.1 DTW domain-containing protein [Marinomonas vulgaris]